MFTAKQYIKHIFTSKNEHSLHSPFMFELYNETVKSDARFYVFDAIEKVRLKLLSNPTPIWVDDMGAGSKVFKTNERKISDLAKHTLKSPVVAQFLFRLARHLKCKQFLELGTSLGITTSYLASIDKQNTVVTLEGAENILNEAQRVFNQLKLTNITSVLGAFDETLPKLLPEIETVDFVLIDGNHTKEATLRYFEMVYPKLNEDSVVVLDDIYWSKDMYEAWEQLINDTRVVVSVDFFEVGLLFFSPRQRKEHFKLKW